ncbi:MAG: DUF3379 family protein [Burkholderiales bacterium]
MDCLSFRRLKLAMPQATSAAQIEHERTCAACADFARQIDKFERDLHDVATVAVPDGLSEKIILSIQQPRWPNRSYLALAATVVLAVIATYTVYLTPDRHEVAEAFAAHVASEPEVLREQGFIEPAKLAAAFSRYGGRLSEPLGEVRHVGMCPILGVMAYHILVQTEHGPATLILLPQMQASTARPLVREGFAVVVVPLQGGSLGILTDTPDQASKVESLIQSRVRWQS